MSICQSDVLKKTDVCLQISAHNFWDMKIREHEESQSELLRNVGTKIKILRQQKQMTQLELAAKCRSDARKIGGYERGEYDLRLSSLELIAQGLEVSVFELLAPDN